MIEIFRIHGADYDVFDTTGTILFEGRWHSRGTRMVYAAEHISLAALEALVHAEGKKLPPKALTRIQLPDRIAIETKASVDFAVSQKFGDAWVSEKRSPVLRVPSVPVNGLESNYLLNPAHPQFHRILHGDPARFPFDTRFFVRR